ncbi:type II/IV secretion system protein [Campylobacter jejuni]|nr:type II/IV secretion system protein [Campylobacter jejuni]
MESRMDKIFQAYIDNEISLDEICTKFNITSWDFFKKLANFCNLHFVDLDEDNDFIYEGIPFSLLLKFKFLLIKNNDGFMIIRSKPCSLELLEQVKTFMICEKIDTAIADELKIAKILNQIRIQEEIKRLSIKLRLEWQENHKRDDQRKTQDGSFELDFENERYDFRVSCLPLIYGESVVIRILKHDKEILDLHKLNLGDKNLKILKKILHRPNGMILLTGPTGSGKSTTLYACLNELKSIEKKIISAEDPIEYKIPLVQQILLNSKVGVEFNSVLRAILRQDPDIIMIGEIRDEESLDIALKASLTGHLLLSTLHTNDALSTIDRLLDMQAKSYLIASALSLVIAQRLVRKLCPWCKQKSKKHYIEFEGEFFEPKGCERCHHSGFFGRELIAECLEINEDLACAIRENQNKTILMELAKKHGFQTMFEQGLKKAKEGLTSIDELLRVVR